MGFPLSLGRESSKGKGRWRGEWKAARGSGGGSKGKGLWQGEWTQSSLPLFFSCDRLGFGLPLGDLCAAGVSACLVGIVAARLLTGFVVCNGKRFGYPHLFPLPPALPLSPPLAPPFPPFPFPLPPPSPVPPPPLPPPSPLNILPSLNCDANRSGTPAEAAARPAAAVAAKAAAESENTLEEWVDGDPVETHHSRCASVWL